MLRKSAVFVTRSSLALLAAAVAGACTDQTATGPRDVAPALATAGETNVGRVFVSTNAVSGNAVVAYTRGADGSLSYLGTYATGGTGIGGAVDPLQSQFALTLSRDRHFLFVVNAGSNEVSSLAVAKDGLTLVDKVSSGGVRPVSVAASNGALYVLNALSNSISGYRIGSDGRLTALPGATVSLSAGAAGAAAVRVSPDGRLLAVTERVSNTIDTYVIAEDGSLSGPTTTASRGLVPFGFDFTPRGQLVVSEAASGSASSYASAPDGTLSLVSGAVPALQRAPCWLIVDNAGRFAYTANAGSASVSGYAIAADGTLTLITPGGLTGDLGAGAQPLDLDMSGDSRFLYVFKNGTGTIGVFAVAGDGTLTALPDATGLVARGGYMGLVAY